MSVTSGASMLLKIGELARRTGMTIRALRHYDEIGLLSPSVRSEGGFRLYGPEDVGKLYRIQALCRLKLPLAEIREVLAAGGAGFPEIMDRQIAALDQQISDALALRAHLGELQSRLRRSEALTMQDWVSALAQMSILSRYFSDDDRRALEKQRSAAGENRDEEKAALVLELQRLRVQGTGPDSEEAQELAYRWIQLLMAEVGGDEGLLMKYYAMQWNEDSLQLVSGIDRAGMAYIAQAMAHRRLKIYAGYCSSEELLKLRRHYIRHTTSWPPLIAALRAHMARDTDPKDREVQRLAREWAELESKKAGGDQALSAKLQQAAMREPALRFGSGIDAAFLLYLDKAMQAVRKNPATGKSRDAG